MTAPIRIGVSGAAGRMGRALVRAAAESGNCTLVAALEHAGHTALGEDAGRLAGLDAAGVPVSAAEDAFFAAADVVIEFTSPEATARHAAMAAATGTGIVIGTTGLDRAQSDAVGRAGRAVPVVLAANMSLGVNLLLHLVKTAATALGPDWDIEIMEMHHDAKRDAPSGTALALGKAAAAGRGIDHETAAVRARDGDTGPRERGTIGYGVLRGGDVVGDHTVLFAGAGERLELGHRAQDRAIFARGAVHAAVWTASRAPGFYGMREVLDLPK